MRVDRGHGHLSVVRLSVIIPGLGLNLTFLKLLGRFALFFHEQLSVLAEEIHVELVLRLFIFVRANVEQNFILVYGLLIFIDRVERFKSRL